MEWGFEEPTLRERQNQFPCVPAADNTVIVESGQSLDDDHVRHNRMLDRMLSVLEEVLQE